MIRFNLKLLLNSRILPLWPASAIILAIIVGIYGDIESAGSTYSFLISFASSPLFPSGLFISGVIGFFVLIAVIGIPFHLNKNLESERAALLLSKPVTRNAFFFSEFAAVTIITFIYSLITVIALAVLLYFEAALFLWQLYLAMLFFIPFYFLVIYISIVLFLILTRSYLASVLLGYLVIPVIASILFNIERFLNLLGWNSDLIIITTDVLSYLFPSAEGVNLLMVNSKFSGTIEMSSDSFEQMLTGVFFDGFAAFDWSLFGFVIASCLPFFLLSYYLMMRKEF